MTRRLLLQRMLAAVLVVVPLAVVALPALAADSEVETLRREWLANRDAVSEAASGLEALDLATSEATAKFEAVEERLAKARRRLATLRSELKAAIVRQEEADAANDVAIRSLGQATMVMITIEEALAEHAEDLDVEIVAAYKYAGSAARFNGMVDALVSSGSITEFSTAYEHLQAGTIDQAKLVDVVTVLAAQLETQRTLVGALQRETAKAEAAAIAEREHVAELTRRQTDLVAQVARDRRERARLVRQLRKETEAVNARLDELEVQSQALMVELSRFRYVGGAPGSNDLVWPTDGAAISGVGYRMHPIFKERRLHAGIDIPGPTGQPVYAARDGVVLTASARGGYGNVIVIDHGDGMSTVYAHLSKFNVEAGDELKVGDDIGDIGSTGNSTGPHLHFEIRLGGSPTDPLQWL